jgi:hypothetical protein
MPTQQIKELDEVECPKCGTAIPISEALRHQLTKELNEEIEQRVKREWEEEKAKIVAKAQKQAEESVTVQMQDLEAANREAQKKLRDSAETELAWLKEKRDLEEAARAAKLEAARDLNVQRAAIEENATRRVVEEHRFKDLENEKVIGDLRRALEDANRKAKQGSQQLQGEVQELDLEAFLKEQFPSDEIKPVAKGIRGADVLQIVTAPSGGLCGSILWESKRTKGWNDGWIGKLKDDQREAKADIAVIVSEVMPRELSNSGYKDRIWVTNYSTISLLAHALRTLLSQVASTKLAAANKDEISDMLFRYVTGPEFRQQVEGMVDTFKEMQETLNKEKRASIARWAKQEKQIEKAITITAGTYGSLRGLIGSSMQSIPALEAEEEGEEDTSSEPSAAQVVLDLPEVEDEPDGLPF